MPVLSSAGQREMETGAPLWTPVPVSDTSLASVVCRAPMKPFMAPVGPRAVFLSSLPAQGNPEPPVDHRTLAFRTGLLSAPGMMPFGPADRPIKNLNPASGGRQITVSFCLLPSESPYNTLNTHTFSPSDDGSRAAPTLNDKISLRAAAETQVSRDRRRQAIRPGPRRRPVTGGAGAPRRASAATGRGAPHADARS